MTVSSEEVVVAGLGVRTVQPNGGSGGWSLVNFERGKLTNGGNTCDRYRSHIWLLLFLFSVEVGNGRNGKGLKRRRGREKGERR